MCVAGVTFGGYLTKILSFKTGNLPNNSKFHLLSEGTVHRQLPKKCLAVFPLNRSLPPVQENRNTELEMSVIFCFFKLGLLGLPPAERPYLHGGVRPKRSGHDPDNLSGSL